VIAVPEQQHPIPSLYANLQNHDYLKNRSPLWKFIKPRIPQQIISIPLADVNDVDEAQQKQRLVARDEEER
jgi:hypothetical protein